jgi:hypothetical protein
VFAHDAACILDQVVVTLHVRESGSVLRVGIQRTLEFVAESSDDKCDRAVPCPGSIADRTDGLFRERVERGLDYLLHPLTG